MQREAIAKEILGENPEVTMVHRGDVTTGHPWAIAAIEALDEAQAALNAEQIREAINKLASEWGCYRIKYSNRIVCPIHFDELTHA